jgi:hypothetical protein
MSHDAPIVSALRTLNRNVAESLCALAHEAPHDARLIWPIKRDDSRRISEQESKILFCHYLDRSPWVYSVETPTRGTYVQSGQTPLSARIDVTLYRDRTPDSRLVNIELKAHNPPIKNIQKDLEKLLREQIPGVWFHTLRNTNRRTLRSLSRKFTRSFRDLKDDLAGTDRTLLFAICILEKGQLLQTELVVNGDAASTLKRVDQIFDGDGMSGWEAISLNA